MGRRGWIAAGALAVLASTLVAPTAAAASPLGSEGDDGPESIEIVLAPFLEIRIVSDQPDDAADPAPEPTATPAPSAPTQPAPAPTPDTSEETPRHSPTPTAPSPEPTVADPERSATTLHDRPGGRVGDVGEAGEAEAPAGGGSRSAPDESWPAVDATVEVGPESISITRVRVDPAVTSALTFAAGGLGMLAVAAAVARRRLLADPPRAPHGRHRAAPPSGRRAGRSADR